MQPGLVALVPPFYMLTADKAGALPITGTEWPSDQPNNPRRYPAGFNLGSQMRKMMHREIR